MSPWSREGCWKQSRPLTPVVELTQLATYPRRLAPAVVCIFAGPPAPGPDIAAVWGSEPGGSGRRLRCGWPEVKTPPPAWGDVGITEPETLSIMDGIQPLLT